MPLLKKLDQDTISQDDVRWIAAAAKTSYYEHTWQDIIALAQTGDCQLWRYKNSGIVVTQLRQAPIGKICDIWLLAGKDMYENGKEIYTEIELWAKELGCKYTEGRAMRPGLKKLYEQFMGQPLSISTYFKEI